MLKNKKGNVEYLSAFMLICLVGLLLAYSFSVKEIRQYEDYAKDGLDSACLSAALIDLERYAYGRFIVIKQENSWPVFKNCLKNNMKLDEDLNPNDKSIYGKVTVHEFIVYNIIEGFLVSYHVTGDGNTYYESKTYSKDDMTPDGSKIISATIYADIGMNVKSFLGIEKYVHIKTSVDVVDN